MVIESTGALTACGNAYLSADVITSDRLLLDVNGDVHVTAFDTKKRPKVTRLGV